MKLSRQFFIIGSIFIPWIVAAQNIKEDTEAAWLSDDGDPVDSLSEEDYLDILLLEELDEELFFVSGWEEEITLTGGTGYKDNALEGTFKEEGSLFFLFSLEMFMWRYPSEGAGNLSFYSLVEQLQYVNVGELDYERYNLWRFDWVKDLSQKLKAGFSPQYTYSNEVFDLAFEEDVSASTLLEFHQFELRTFLKRALPADTFLQLDLVVRRDFFRDSSDDNTEPGVELEWGKHYGDKNTLSFKWKASHKRYDTRNLRDEDGVSVSDTSLRSNRNEIQLELKHYWDTERKWQTKTKFQWKTTDDGREHYSDYDRCRVNQSLKYEGDNWALWGAIELSYYDYRAQAVSHEDDSVLYYTSFRLEIDARKKISEKWSVFLRMEHDRSFSNRREDEIEQNTALIGFDYLL